MIPFTLRQLEYFIAVAEALNFRLAARHCHVTQPALSEQIRLLEESLGVELFERRPRAVRLTAAGERLVVRARNIMQQAEELEREAQVVADPYAFPLRLGSIPTIAPYLFPQILPSLRKELPVLKCFLYEDQTLRLLERLESGKIDLALLALPIRPEGFEICELFREKFSLITTEETNFGRRKHVDAEMIESLDLLLLEEGHCLADQALEYCYWARSREGSADLRASSMSTLLQMVAGGMGATLLPEMALELELGRNRGLRAWPICPPTPGRSVGLVWRKGSARQSLIEESRQAISRALRS